MRIICLIKLLFNAIIDKPKDKLFLVETNKEIARKVINNGKLGQISTMRFIFHCHKVMWLTHINYGAARTYSLKSLTQRLKSIYFSTFTRLSWKGI